MLLVSLLLTINIMETFLDVNTRRNTLLPWPKSIYVLSMCFKVRLRIMFFGNLRIKFLELFALIVNNMERINTKKKNNQHIAIAQSFKITLILYECHRSIDNSIFIFLSCCEKAHDNKIIQSWKFKTSLWITNHNPLSWTLGLEDIAYILKLA